MARKYPQEFENLWKIWPHRYTSGGCKSKKYCAFKAWNKQTKRTKNLIYLRTVDLNKWIRAMVRTNRQVPYQRLLVTWINQEGWDDTLGSISIPPSDESIQDKEIPLCKMENCLEPQYLNSLCLKHNSIAIYYGNNPSNKEIKDDPTTDKTVKAAYRLAEARRALKGK